MTNKIIGKYAKYSVEINKLLSTLTPFENLEIEIKPFGSTSHDNDNYSTLMFNVNGFKYHFITNEIWFGDEGKDVKGDELAEIDLALFEALNNSGDHNLKDKIIKNLFDDATGNKEMKYIKLLDDTAFIIQLNEKGYKSVNLCGSLNALHHKDDTYIYLNRLHFQKQ